MHSIKNRRILKKKCKRACEVLIEEFGFKSDEFSQSEKGEWFATRTREEAAVLDNRRATCLPGTWIWQESPEYWTGEFDCYLAYGVLMDQIFFTHLLTDRKIERMEAEADACYAAHEREIQSMGAAA
ncbi:hypothetical protein ACMG4P_04875 [Pseudovibrio denitrificans]|uniref:hypothetical protein n=1 Tax=Pseudovibrio denitrificans TaxID=258256 RepID=UPI0039BF4534